MFGFPFKTIYLKTNLNRENIYQLLLNQTFLSDLNYKNINQSKKTFFGEVSNQDFKLETINNQNIANFAHGEIKGVENDMYLIVHFGALEHIRIYALFLATFLVSTFFLVEGLYHNYQDTYGPAFFDNSIHIALTAVELILFAIIFIKWMGFRKSMKPTIEFFEILFQAKSIQKNDVPVIFTR